jgi:hypothetical protein
MKHEVALRWTDNHQSRKLYRNVPVQYLRPGRPLALHRAMIIRGNGVGVIGEFDMKIRGTKNIRLYCDGTNASIIVPEKDLCRLADPDVLHVSELT